MTVNYDESLLDQLVTSLDIAFDSFTMPPDCEARFIAAETSMSAGSPFTLDKLREDVATLTCAPITNIDVELTPTRLGASDPTATRQGGPPQRLPGVRVSYTLTVSKAPGASEWLYAELTKKYCAAKPADMAFPAAK